MFSGLQEVPQLECQLAASLLGSTETRSVTLTSFLCWQHTCKVLIQASGLPVVHFVSEIGFLGSSQLDFGDVSLPQLWSGEVRRAWVLYKDFLGFVNLGT